MIATAVLGAVMALGGGAERPARIAYEAASAVATIRPDGSGARRIRNSAGEPVWSPDGTRILFTRDEGEGIWTMRDDGSRPRLIVDWTSAGFGGRRPGWVGGGSWSPDGRSIAFVAGFPTTGDRTGYEVWRADTDGDDFQRLAAGTAADWAPDDTWIALVQDGPPGAWGNRIAVMRPDGTDLRVLIEDARASHARPDFAPDGERLAYFQTARVGATHVRTLDLSSSRQVRFPVRPGHTVTAATWTPTRQDVVYAQRVVRPGADGPTIVTAARTGGMRRRVRFTVPDPIDALAWRPAG